jgi:hypothetical protein
MYQFLHDRFGVRAAYWGIVAWYALLMTIVLLTSSTPAAEFRYGNI